MAVGSQARPMSVGTTGLCVKGGGGVGGVGVEAKCRALNPSYALSGLLQGAELASSGYSGLFSSQSRHHVC